MSAMRRILILPTILLFLLAIFAFKSQVLAQTLGIPGLVNNTEISDTNGRAGDILSNTSEGIKRSAKAYDQEMIGVIVESPVISVGEKTATTVAVLFSGRAVVNVSAKNGAIKPGDFITSSDNAGIGQKATAAGYVLGKALASYEDASRDGQVPVIVEIGYFTLNPNIGGLLGSLLALLSIGFGNAQNFSLVMKYLAAALVGVMTFGFTSFSFVRFMRNGIEAIGRNPLAKNTIISGMVLNGIVVGLLAIAGFGIAVAIVVL